MYNIYVKVNIPLFLVTVRLKSVIGNELSPGSLSGALEAVFGLGFLDFLIVWHTFLGRSRPLLSLPGFEVLNPDGKVSCYTSKLVSRGSIKYFEHTIT